MGVYKFATHRFNDEEIDFLKIHYPIGDWDSINKYLPYVSKQSIHTKMSELGISMESYYWTKEDERILSEKYEYMYGHVDNLIELFNRKYTYKSIISKARKLGLKTREYWSEEEISIIKNFYSNTSLDKIMELLPNRKRGSIIVKANNLGYKNCCKYQDWEVKFIIDNWRIMTDQEIASTLSKSRTSITCKRISLGLLRQKENSSYDDLSEYVRRNNFAWKRDSMLQCKYKCVLTENRFDDIHHIYGLNLILNEVLEELNIEIKKNMNEYSQEELIDILDLFRIKQSEYPLGVCLSRDVHVLFHREYGYGNNTEDQWDQFVNDFKHGKYKNTLNVA